MSFFWWCLCICCLWLKACASDSWNIGLSPSVVGLEGSCLDISCQYSYPGSTKMSSVHKGIWFTDSNEKVYHSEVSQISTAFQHRTSVGDLKQRNCSLKINPLRHGDKGPFIFRIEIDGFDKYSFLNHKVSVTVKDSPDPPIISVDEEMKSGKKVTVTCFIFHSCPSDPPRLTWNHQGTISTQSEKEHNDQWKLISFLSFTPTKLDHNKILKCTAEFTGGKKVSSIKTLNVRYPPVNVEVISRSTVEEGSSVELTCSSNSNPVAQAYQWLTKNGSVLSEGRNYTIKSVSRHFESLYCTAANTEGRASSSLIQLNVVYPPDIKAGSSCTSEFSTVTCLCMVDSNPSSDIKWWGSDQTKVLHSSNTEKHGSLSVVTLQGALHSDTVHCFANNSQGHSTMTLRVPHSDKLIYTAVAVSVFLGIVIGLTVWMVKRSCVSSRAEQPVTHTKTEMDVTRPGSERKCDAYSTYDEGQHVYGNMGLEDDNYPYTFEEPDDDATYANV
ncbi:myelin-associated glycoprotein [Salminus brasiliensis]|uniref:myelin-associated glycoprotein n=1 Tax=Salminus brasiliensis TaxID=930266 RepID=UPI003B834A9A